MKILNLYAGIGGNRKLWGDEHEIVAVELKPKIAEVYQSLFPRDRVVVGDAHEYLLKHFKEFDFIWSSPPCPSHSKARYGLGFHGGKVPAIYPDMNLYQEIILLSTHFKGKYCVENVIAYYQPLIIPQTVGRHFYWANFIIPHLKVEPTGITQGGAKYKRKGSIRAANTEDFEKRYGYDLSKYDVPNKRLMLRNCVEPEIGKYILDFALGTYKPEPIGLFAANP
jgi:DNA (cytosine-5)-methyltransferase 1